MDYKTADRLIELRKKYGYSQDELAGLLDISRQAVSKWERAESLPDTENLIALAKLYNVSLDELVHGTQDPELNMPRKKVAVSAKALAKVFGIIGFAAMGFGILFSLIALGSYLGFALPESIELGLARNESISPISADIVKCERANVYVNNEAMYRVVFEWQDGTGKSNAVYTREEAESLVGTKVQIRVDGDMAVMVDYQISVLTIIGYAFLGAFGFIGLAGFSVSIVFFTLKHGQNKKAAKFLS